MLWLYGRFVDKDPAANVVPVNSSDHWLHFVLGVGMLAAGVVLGRRVSGSR